MNFFEDSDFQYRIEKQDENWYILYLYDRNEAIGYDEYSQYKEVEDQFVKFEQAIIKDTGYKDFYLEPKNNVEFSGGFTYYMIDDENVKSYISKLFHALIDARYTLSDVVPLFNALVQSGNLDVDDIDSTHLDDLVNDCDAFENVLRDAIHNRFYS